MRDSVHPVRSHRRCDVKKCGRDKELWTVLQFQSIIKPSKDVSDLL